MNKKLPFISLAGVGLVAILSACNSNSPREPVCSLPQGPDLEQSLGQARFDLNTGCEGRFDDYFSRLLNIAEGDPKLDNKAHFSDFLLWANQQGLLSKRQARRYYNRYFGVKFVSLIGDYSVCSDTCKHKADVLRDMRQELADKELGLLKVSADRRAYSRASRLLRETELVLEATCSACGAGD